MPSAAGGRAADNFALLFEHSPSGLLVVDRAGRILFLNREIERIYGYHRDELIGQPVERLVPQAGRASHVHARDQFHGTRETRPMGHQRHVHGVRKDGTVVHAEVGLVPLDMDGVPVVLASIVDVSERETLLEQLRQQAAELRRSNEELTQFAFVAAHDLQEPLRMVASCAEMLDERCRPSLDDKGLK